MNVVIIEDEQDAYKRLSKLIKETFAASTIVAHLEDVQSAKTWFESHESPDIVFIDINLGDGTGFDVLNLVDIRCPYVFVTAYDQYAIDAFQTNSIAYLLKPITTEDLEAVLKKLEAIPKMFGLHKDALPASQSSREPKYKKRFIVRLGIQIKIIHAEEIAYLYSQSGVSFIRTDDNRTFPLDYSLEVLQEMLDPQVFFRINRQYIVGLHAISNMQVHSKGRIVISLNPPTNDFPVVSAERAAEFRQWLADEL